MNCELFAKDLAAKPAALRGLAERLEAGPVWGQTLTPASSIVLLGMGSSHYANSVCAARLRAKGINAVAEIASSEVLPAVNQHTIVIGVSASGGSVETLTAMATYLGRCPVIALTNTAGSAITSKVDQVVEMLAGAENSGVACRSFQITLGLLLALESQLLGGVEVPMLLRGAAGAEEDLLGRLDTWLPMVRELMLGPQGTYAVAPAARFSSAQQSALMLRECPRLPAFACETGDWSHVDVYLTKTTDYRMLLFAGSPWVAPLMGWVTERKSTVVAVGADVAGSRMNIRYRGDQTEEIRLLAEVAVAEQLALLSWSESGAPIID